jgi:hypothetical protein
MRRQRFTGGGREAATVTVASGTVTVAISTCCGNCNPRQPWVATNAARDICYAKRVANFSNAAWPRYSERDKCNALVPEWFTTRTLSLTHSVLPSSTKAVTRRARGALHSNPGLMVPTLCSSNRNGAYRQMRAAQAGFTNTAQTGLVCPALHQIPMLPRRMEGAETLTCFCTPNLIFYFGFTLKGAPHDLSRHLLLHA